MSKQRRGYARRRPTPPPRHPWRALVVGGAAVAAVAVIALAVVLNAGGRAAIAGATSWSTLGTQDVHSLAFDPADQQHLYFGHHGGLLETKDGGRNWQGTALRGADAMNVAPQAGDFFQIAGHNVYMETPSVDRLTPVVVPAKITSPSALAARLAKPDFADLMPEIAAAGRSSVLVVPVQFLADHLEILYDIDVGARAQAERCGLSFNRIDSLNAHPGLIEALAEVARRTLEAGQLAVRS